MADALFSTLYDLDDFENAPEKIDLDELFDRRRTYLQKEIDTYKKVLCRIHNKIKVVSRQRTNNDFLAFLVPEFIIGLPRYDVLGCIGFCMEKLKENGFSVKYTHPNLLFISWRDYIPTYERDLIKKRLGVKVDERGNVVSADAGRGSGSGAGAGAGASSGRLRTLDEAASLEERDLMMFSRRERERPGGDSSDRDKDRGKSSNRVTFAASSDPSGGQKQYRDISSYTPRGIYNRDRIG